MENELPKSWVKGQISDLADVTSGIGFPKEYQGQNSGSIPFYKVGDISRLVQSGEKYLQNADHYVDDETRVKLRGKVFSEGTIVFAKIGEALRLNRRAIITQPSLVDNNVMGVVPLLKETSMFLYYYLYTQDLGLFSAGNAVPSVRKSSVLDIDLPIPPLPEQKRIVAKLDALFGHLDSVKTKLDRIPELLKNFRQQVLMQAVTGKLTEEWRTEYSISAVGILKDALKVREENWLERKSKELELKGKSIDKKKLRVQYKKPLELEEIVFENVPESWENAVWDQVSDWVTYGFTRPMPHDEDGYPIVTGKNVINGSINFDKVHLTNIESFNELNEKDLPVRDDILITKDGSIGRAAIVETDEPFCINQSVAVVWLRNSPLNRKYLLNVILCESSQQTIKLKSKGVAIQHLSVTDFRKMHLPLPPREEQDEIVKKVEDLFDLADSIESQYNLLKAKIDQLPQAILNKAFKGELVAQDAGDEPAIQLLKRVQNEKGGKG